MPDKTVPARLRETLEALWRFRHPSPVFWQELLHAFTMATDSATGVVLCKKSPDAPWVSLATRPEAEETHQRLNSLKAQIEQIADQCLGTTDAFSVLETELDSLQLAALPLVVKDGETDIAVVVIRYSNTPFVAPERSRCRLMSDSLLICGINELTAARPADDVTGTAARIDPLITAMELSHLLNEKDRYLAACMLICNELATRFACDRVSVGRYDGQYAALESTSHAQKVSRGMEASRLLTAAMEEAIEQDDEVVWPSPAHQWVIDRDHERYTRDQAVRYMVTLPLRLDGHATAVISLERNSVPFLDQEVDTLRLVADMSARRLEDLRLRDRWFGARLGSSLMKSLAFALGREHTLVRLAAVGVTLLILFLVFFQWNYRIEAPFSARTDLLTHVPAPFDAYIESVSARIGDQAEQGQTLLVLDSKEIDLKRQQVQAAIDRYQGEAQLAQAKGDPSEMHIALSKAEEQRIELKTLDYNLARAEVKAPLEGIIVQGDLKERVGSPVKKGEPLFQITRIDNLYFEVKVNERDIHEVRVGAAGSVAFTSRPQAHIAFVVSRIEPVAIAESGGNVFIVRCTPTDASQAWWRPGLSGSSRIDAGQRRLIWVLTHRLINILRMKFWV